MANWSVQITGDKFDLEDLPDWFSRPDLHVVAESDGYYLRSSRFASAQDANEVRKLAQELTERMVGAAKLFCPNFQNIELGAIIDHEEDDRKHVHVFVSGTFTLRSKIKATVSIGSKASEPQIPKPSLWASIAATEDRVAHALRLWGKGPHDWINLYKVLEIIESDVGHTVHQSGWISKAEVTRFTQTANSAEAIGDAARHAKKHVPAPPKPVTIQEARQLLKGLLERWIESKALTVS